MLDTSSWSDLEKCATGLLSAAERRRSERFRFEQDRCTYVIAHALWRVLLGMATETLPDRVSLQFLPGGQPQLPGTGLTTSLSHSGPMALMAVGSVRALGIDIERCPTRVAMFELLRVICSDEERDILQAMPPERREWALLQLWTRKEAVLKAWGTGLGQAPSSFSALPGALVVPPKGVDGEPCLTMELALPEGQAGALAVSLDVLRHTLHILA
ncbi:4'-phosphopantetheinyl transferase [Pseudoxanthomonas sp. GM95]|uniref:4'-phosphopantetheinyl transferase family protein n=1 Tax=Pseudoxanthomonas sp. GM95 TaxID=1881043 RepID=UPI0008D05705|nr:4'-phosphopantetheinyl transferase superfamily protein [Pseudoxanthomonas sp. GM95]SEL08911.1 4'-phosphopantetheinyl transferase [Pseudoxanthomonas sp. GM95]